MRSSIKHSCQGFTLIELLLSSLLGLLVIGGVIGVLLSSSQISRQTENLARLQESARYALEIVGRDLREAGGISCGSNLSPINAVAGSNWWSNWDDGMGIHGYGDTQALPAKAIGTNATERVTGTDAIIIRTSTAGALAPIASHAPASWTFTATSSFEPGDILMACDYTHAALFQVTSVSGTTIGYGNTITLVAFAAGGQLGKLSSNAWYVGYNGRGGTSLYRVELSHSGSSPTAVTTEIAEGISNLQIQYLIKNAAGTLASDYVDAASITDVTDWTRVVAARIAFTLRTAEAIGTSGQPIAIEWKSVVSLRNRLP